MDPNTATPEPTPAPIPDDAFAAAFDELSRAEAPKEPEVAVDAPAETPADPAPAATGAEPEPAAAAETPPAETAAPEAPADPAPVEEPKASEDDDLLARLAAAIKKQPEPEPRQAAPKQAEAPVEKAPEPAPEPEPELYTPEDKSFLEQYEKDWPDVARGEALKRRAEQVQMVGYIFDQIQKAYGPYMEMAHAAAQQVQLNVLEKEVPEYSDQLRSDVEAWVETQPAWLRPTYQHVIERGTVEEVKGLVGMYRQSKGPAPAPAPVKRDAELPPVAKQAAQSLAPVRSARSAVSTATDPNDFESAWEQAAKML